MDKPISKHNNTNKITPTMTWKREILVKTPKGIHGSILMPRRVATKKIEKETRFYSINRFINKHGFTKKKQKKRVTFCEWSPKLDMPRKGNHFERLLYNKANQTVLNLLTMKLGMYRRNDKRSRTKGFPTDEIDDECYFWFREAWDEEDKKWIHFKDGESVMEDLIMPMASAIIHRTPFLSLIEKFQDTIEETSSYIREKFLYSEFWRDVESVLNDDYDRDWDYLESKEYQEFEKSGWRHNVQHLFLLFLESHKARLLGVIQEIKYLYERPNVASVEDMIKKQVWGALVWDWVRKRGNEEEYIHLYESQGALRWYLDFVIPERQRAKLIGMMKEIECLNNTLATLTSEKDRMKKVLWGNLVRMAMTDVDELRVSIVDGDRGIDYMLLHEDQGAVR